MTTLPFPKVAMKVIRIQNGFDLMMKHPASEAVVRVATVHDEVNKFGTDTAQSFANCLSAAFLMIHCLDFVIDFEQPDGWGDDMDVEQANAWRAIFRAHSIAQGQPIHPTVAYDTPYLDNEP